MSFHRLQPTFLAVAHLLVVGLFSSFCGTLFGQEAPRGESEDLKQGGKAPAWIFTVNPSESVDSEFTKELFRLLEVPEELQSSLRGLKLSLFGFGGADDWVVSVRNLKGADKILAAIEGGEFHSEVRNGSELLLSLKPLSRNTQLTFDDKALLAIDVDIEALGQDLTDSGLIRRFHRFNLSVREDSDSGGLSVEVLVESRRDLPDGEEVEAIFRKLATKLGERTGLPLQGVSLKVKPRSIRLTASLDETERRKLFSLVAATLSSAMEKAEELPE